MTVLRALAFVFVVLFVPVTFTAAKTATVESCKRIKNVLLVWPDGYRGCCFRGQHAVMRNVPGHEHQCSGGRITYHMVGECRCASPSSSRCVVLANGQHACVVP